MKVKELLMLIIKNEAPKKIYFEGMEFEIVDEYDKNSEYEFTIENTPLMFLYRNTKNCDEFLFREYGITINDDVEIIKKRPRKKVKCIETNKIFNSPCEAGRYYGFEDGDMVSKVCRRVHETAKGLHFVYIEEKENEEIEVL